MAHSAKAGGKRGAAKTRKASPLKGSNPKTRVQETQTVDPQQLIAELRCELEQARAELGVRNSAYSERIAYQAAANDVLKVMSDSPGDPQPVFDLISVRARDLCDAYGVTVYEFDGSLLHWRAATGVSDDPAEREAAKAAFPLPPSLDLVVGRAILSRAIVHIRDYETEPGLRRFSLAVKSTVSVPLMRGGVPIGALQMGSRECGGFSEAQVGLLQTFADQAVIAIENARLFNETQEALERQTATADVLKVISRSAFDLEPVLDALLSSACRLCAADIGTIRYRAAEGGDFRLAATFGCLPEWKEHFLKYSTKADRSSLFGRTILEGRTIHLPDVLADPDFGRPEAQRLIGFRSALSVPLAREGQAFGVINVFRFEIGAFESRQIEVLQTFADQAVIAIENTRLFNETQESLQRQTATADVLKVISRSTFDLQKVLDTLTESVCRLCDAYDAIILLCDGEYLRIAAHYGEIPVVDKWPISRDWIGGRCVIDRTTIYVHDLMAEEAEYPRAHAFAQETGHRTLFAVPLLRDQDVIGAINIRRTEVRSFTDKQIELVSTFADQAVIAIENARLFNEVQAKTHDLEEALRYQTGSANILNVIASSPTDVQPVLESIVKSACGLCEAYDAVLVLKHDSQLHVGAHHGDVPLNRTKWPSDRSTISGRAISDQSPIHVHDIVSQREQFPTAEEMSRRDGGRTVLGVPMVRDRESVGAIVLRRTEVHPFNEKQISLLQTFADQAVIAIGNVRLFEQVQERTRDLQESLEQQTATSEVLQTISASSGELKPVFNKMLENATRICGARFGTMTLYEDGGFRTVALYNAPKAYADTQLYSVIRPHPESGLSAVRRTHRPIHIADIRNEPPYIEGNAHVRALAHLGAARTLVIVPMLKEDQLVGSITIYRQEVKPFTEKQTELVANFANQAVIAIENARLLNELRSRTDELSKSLDDLRAAQDRLVQTEKLASLGQLTAGIAHEIKNPLNFVNNFSALSIDLTDELNGLLKQAALAEQVRKEVDEVTGLLKSNLEKVVHHGKRADSIVKNMLLHSREGSGELRAADINGLVEESLNLAYHGARAEKSGFNITLERNFDVSTGAAELYPQEITRALLNLISNGFYAATKRKNENGEAGFEPTLLATTRNLGASVEIRIRDNGTGIPAEVKERIFNPFFTTKPAGEGTGLGLSMTHDIIVKQHGGTISVETKLGAFTEFIVTLPRATGVKDDQRSAK